MWDGDFRVLRTKLIGGFGPFVCFGSRRVVRSFDRCYCSVKLAAIRIYSLWMNIAVMNVHEMDYTVVVMCAFEMCVRGYSIFVVVIPLFSIARC